MDEHDPDGATTYSAFSYSSITRRATLRASSRKPVLNAGWPQQVCAGSNVTSTSNRFRIFTTHSPTLGKNWSARQVIKRAIRGFAMVSQTSNAIGNQREGQEFKLHVISSNACDNVQKPLPS